MSACATRGNRYGVPKEPLTVVAGKVTAAEREALERLAEERERPVSFLVRKAVQQFLAGAGAAEA